MATIARRLSTQKLLSTLDLQPLSLATKGNGAALTVACAGGIVLVTGVEAIWPGLASLGSLLFIPVLLSAWLTGQRQALIVSALAVGARTIGYGWSGVDVSTAVAEVTVLGLLAIMTRVAAVGLVERRERAAEMDHKRRAIDLLEQRDKIALGLADTALRRLYALTISLEGTSSRVDEPAVKSALREAIVDVDELSVAFRVLVFKPDGSSNLGDGGSASRTG